MDQNSIEDIEDIVLMEKIFDENISDQKYSNIQTKLLDTTILLTELNKKYKRLNKKYKRLNNTILDSGKCYTIKCDNDNCDFMYHHNEYVNNDQDNGTIYCDMCDICYCKDCFGSKNNYCVCKECNKL